MRPPLPAAAPPEDALRRAYQDLQERLRRYRALLELSADWVWQQDAQFRFTELGVATKWPDTLPAMGSMLGRARWEVPGYEMPQGWAAHRAMLERHEAYRDVELRHRLPDGTERILSVSGMPTFDADARFSGYIGVGRDVTDRRKAQEALRESQRAMSALISNLPGMAYRCRNEPDWPVEFMSDGAWALTGYAAAELMRQEPRYGELIHPEDRDRVWREVQAALSERRQFQLVYRLCTRHGVRWVWEQGSGVFDGRGEVSTVEGFVTDVTEARQAQDEVRRLNAGLEQRVQERTAQLETAHAELQGFAHAIAHDLRAPLTTIAGFSQLLERTLGERADATEARWLRRLSAAAQHMGVLTEALVAIAALASATLLDEEVDLAEHARATLHRLQRAELERRVTLEIPPHLWARGDPRLLAQVIAHLVDNAWKFSRRKDETFVRVGSVELDGETAYFVSDRGAGFDMAHASHLFTRFQRLHSPAEFEGAGVGLALSHRIVLRHGGRMWAQAQPGEGATFYFTLGGRA